MKIIIKTVLLLMCLSLSNSAFSQAPKAIYYLVDTAKVPKNDRIVEVVNEGAYHVYHFFCKCISGYDRNIVFMYLSKMQTESVKKEKLPASLISWKELSKLLWQEGRDFDFKYALHIVEALPGNKYTVNKTRIYLPERSIDYEIITSFVFMPLAF